MATNKKWKAGWEKSTAQSEPKSSIADFRQLDQGNIKLPLPKESFGSKAKRIAGVGTTGAVIGTLDLINDANRYIMPTLPLFETALNKLMPNYFNLPQAKQDVMQSIEQKGKQLAGVKGTLGEDIALGIGKETPGIIASYGAVGAASKAPQVAKWLTGAGKWYETGRRGVAAGAVYTPLADDNPTAKDYLQNMALFGVGDVAAMGAAHVVGKGISKGVGRFKASGVKEPKPINELDNSNKPETPAIKIEGNEFGEGISTDQLRNTALHYARNTFKQPVTNAETGMEIRIPVSGIKHVISLSGDIRKVQLLYALPDILKKSIYIGAEKPYKPNQNIRAIHRFQTVAEVGSDSVKVNSVIRETNEGRLFYDYRLSNIQKESAGSPGSMNLEGSKPSGATDSYDLNITSENLIGNGQIKVNQMEEASTEAGDNILGDMGELQLRDISGLNAYMRDVYRNFRDVFGERFQDIQTRVLDPLDDAKGKYVDLQGKYLDELEEKIVKGLGIKKGSKESALVQRYGEGNMPTSEWHRLDPELQQKIVETDAWFRKVYDDLVDEINLARESIYPNAEARMVEIKTKMEDLKSPGKYSKKVQNDKIQELEWELNLLRSNPRRRSTEDTLYMQQLERKIDEIKNDPVFTVHGRKDMLAGLEAEYERAMRGKYLPKRKDYYRHFRELEGLEGLRNIFDTPAQISPELAGVSDFTRPNSRWQSFMQKRNMGPYKEDAVGGFLNYMPNAAWAVHIDPQIKTFRELKEALVEGPGSKGNLNHFIEYLEDYANDLAGKTSPFDRNIQKVLGRRFFNVVTWANNRVKSNAILGNVGTTVAQVANIPQGVAFAKQYSQKGLIRFNRSVIQRFQNPEEFMRDNPMAKSSFLKERYADGMYRRFDTGILAKTKDAAVAMMEAADRIGTEFIWNACYEKGLALKGVTDPVRYADQHTRRLVAGRGIGEVPLMQKSKVFQVAAPFQLEVANLWHVLTDMKKDKDVAGGAILLMTLYLFNRGAEKVRGSGVTLDPVQAIVDSVNTAGDDELSAKEKAARIAGRNAGEILSNIPFGQTVANYYPEYGGQWMGVDGWPTRKDFFGREDPTRFGSGLLVTKALENPLSKLVPPWGGVQLDKTYRGIKAMTEGGVYSRDGGELKYPVEPEGLNAFKGILFGPSGFKETPDYYDNDRRPLSENQTEEFLKRVNAGEDSAKVYAEMMKERQQRSEGKKNPEKKANGTESNRWKEGW